MKFLKQLLYKNKKHQNSAVKFYIQSLLTTDRAHILHKNLHTFSNIDIFHSINGYNDTETLEALSKSNLDFHNLYNHESLRYGVLANFLTKFQALEHQVDNKIDYMCLIEDDVVLNRDLLNLIENSTKLLDKDQNLNMIRFGQWGECYLWSLPSAIRVLELIRKSGIINNIDNQLRLNCGKELWINYPIELFQKTNEGDCLSTSYIDLKKINKSYLSSHKHIQHAKSERHGIYFFSQNGSDAYLYDFIFKNWKDGFYIDIGATNGVNSNNTLFLENHLNWKGLLVEPSFEFETLFQNRGNKNIIKKCFLSDKDNETLSFGHCKTGCFASDSKIWDPENMKKEDHSIFSMQSKTLNTLLFDLNLSDQVIDFISISTNGFELPVIKGLDLSQHTVKLFLIKNSNKDIDQHFNNNEFIKIVNISSYSLYINSKFINLLKYTSEDFPKWSNYW